MSTIKSKIISAPIISSVPQSLQVQTNDTDRIIISDAGQVDVKNSARVQGLLTPTSGVGLEMGYANQGVLQAFDRDASQWKPMGYGGSLHSWGVNGSPELNLNSDGSLTGSPNGNPEGLYPNYMLYAINANRTMSNVTTAQSIFGVSSGTLQPGRYRYRIVAIMSKTANTGSISFGLNYTATLANHIWLARTRLGAALTTVAAVNAAGNSNTASGNTSLVSGATVAASTNTLEVEGVIEVSGAGTFNPVCSYSAAPGTLALLRGSFIEVFRIGDIASNTNIGGWA